MNTTKFARLLPNSSEMKSVQRKVTGYGSTPTAIASGYFHSLEPSMKNARFRNRVMPRMLSMVSEPRNRPANSTKTRSRRSCS